MLGALLLIGLVGAVLALPLLLVGFVLKLVFRIILIPFEILGAILTVGVLGLAFLVLGLSFGAVIGAVTLVGCLVAAVPVLILGLAIWGLFRLLRGRKASPTP
jgi:hypothetical protein